MTGPVPNVRSSSLRAQGNRPLPNSPYGSMLYVDAPRLGPLQAMVYDELYPPGCITEDGTGWSLMGSCNNSLAYDTDTT